MKTERLTVRTPTGAALKLNYPKTEQEAREQLMAAYKIAINKLADYEDAEEQGKITIVSDSDTEGDAEDGKKI